MVIDRGHTAFLLDAEAFAADAPEAFARRLVTRSLRRAGSPMPDSPDSRQRARWISRSLAEWTRSSAVRPALAAGTPAKPKVEKTDPLDHSRPV